MALDTGHEPNGPNGEDPHDEFRVYIASYAALQAIEELSHRQGLCLNCLLKSVAVVAMTQVGAQIYNDAEVRDHKKMLAAMGKFLGERTVPDVLEHLQEVMEAIDSGDVHSGNPFA